MTDIIIQGIGGRMGHALCEMIANRSDCRVAPGSTSRTVSRTASPYTTVWISWTARAMSSLISALLLLWKKR